MCKSARQAGSTRPVPSARCVALQLAFVDELSHTTFNPLQDFEIAWER